MSDALFISSDELSGLVQMLGACVGAGLAIAFVFAVFGSGIRLIWDFVRA